MKQWPKLWRDFWASLLVVLIFFGPHMASYTYAQTCSYPNDKFLSEQQKNCATKPGMRWDCESNRCVGAENYQKTIENDVVDKCSEMEGKAKEQCFTKNAESLSGAKKGSSQPSVVQTAAVGTLAVVAALFAIGSMGDKTECLSWSYKLMIAGGVVGALGELVTYFMHQKKSKDMIKKYKEISKQDDKYQAQYMAFQFLEKEQKLQAKMLNQKSIVYFLAAGLFAIGTVLAVLETTKVGVITPPCQPQPQATATPAPSAVPSAAPTSIPQQDINTNGSPVAPDKVNPGDVIPDQPGLPGGTVTYFDELNFKYQEKEENKAQKYWNKFIETLIPRAEANADMFVAMGIPVGVGVTMTAIFLLAPETFQKGFGEFMRQSETRIIMGSVMTSVNTALGAYSKIEADKAEDRAKKVKALGEQFYRENDGLYDCRQTSNKDKPQCFCYTADRKPDPAKASNKICVAHFGKKRDFTASQYEDDQDMQGVKACIVASTKQFDPACKCKSQIKSDGKNNCYTADMGSFTGAFDNAKFVPQLTSTSNALTGGQASIAQVNAAELKKAAFSAKALADNLIKDKFPKALPFTNLNSRESQALLNKVTRNVPKDVLNKFNGNQGALATMSAPPVSAQEAQELNSAAQAAGIAGQVSYEPPQQKSVPQAAKTDFSGYLQNGDGSAEGGAVVEDANYMDKNYKMGDNDISKNSDESLFKIVSHRYIQSGLSKLFTDEGLGPEATPNSQNSSPPPTN